MGFWWRAGAKVISESTKAGARLGRTLDEVSRDAARRRRVRGGILGPGDPSPAPGDLPDHYDYRGVADLSRERVLPNGPFRLGRYIHPRKGLGAELGLSRHDLLHHTAIIGPTGCGKTTGLIVPWIGAAVQSGGFVVTVDVKGAGADDDLATLIGRELDRRSLPRSLLETWDYTRSDSSSWNPFDDMTSDRSFEVATKSILGRAPGADRDRYFYERDYRWLRALLHIAKAPPARSLGDLHRALVGRDRFLTFMGGRASRWADDVADLASYDDYEFGRAVGGLLNKLHVFTLDDVARIMAGAVTYSGSDIRLKGRLIDRGGSSGLDRVPPPPRTLLRSTAAKRVRLADAKTRAGVFVVGAPTSDGELAETLSALFLSQAVNTLLQGGSHAGGAYLIVDEAPRLADRIRFEEVVSIGRSAGLAAVLVAQDVAQFKDPDERSAIMTNCNTFVACRGVSRATTDYLSGRLGDRVEDSVSTTEGARSGPARRRDTARSLGSVPVLRHREIAHPPFGDRVAVVHSSNLVSRPVLVELSFEGLTLVT